METGKERRAFPKDGDVRKSDDPSLKNFIPHGAIQAAVGGFLPERYIADSEFRPLGDLRIIIDGNISDWPLDKFKKVAEQPLFPDGQNADSTSAQGDHIVFDRARIGRVRL